MDDIIIKALATKKTKEFILAHPEYRLNLGQKLRLFYFNYLRKRGWSIAVISGHKEFYGLDFLVNKHTLVPRPDTELMVEEAVSEISKSKNIVLVDVGTGTGCIPISIARTIAHTQSTNKPINQLTIYATDISRGALRLARKNADKHNIKINFLRGNLLQPLKNYWLLATGSELIITANLPYLTQQQFDSELSIQKEPKQALVADAQDGLSLYKKLLEQINILISNHQYPNISIFLEIDPSQTFGIKKMIQNFLPAVTVEIKNDLARRDRLVIIRKKY